MTVLDGFPKQFLLGLEFDCIDAGEIMSISGVRPVDAGIEGTNRSRLYVGPVTPGNKARRAAEIGENGIPRRIDEGFRANIAKTLDIADDGAIDPIVLGVRFDD